MHFTLVAGKGAAQAELARSYGVSQSTISRLAGPGPFRGKRGRRVRRPSRVSHPFRRKILRELRGRGLVGGPFPIIDEAHGERLAGHAVSKRLREGQGGTALERLRHGRVIR